TLGVARCDQCDDVRHSLSDSRRGLGDKGLLAFTYGARHPDGAPGKCPGAKRSATLQGLLRNHSGFLEIAGHEAARVRQAERVEALEIAPGLGEYAGKSGKRLARRFRETSQT